MVFASGCDLSQQEQVIEGLDMQASIERSLGLRLEEDLTPTSVANMHNVTAVYSARSANERIVAVVFDSADATVQFFGRPRPRFAPGRGVVLRRRNVVMVYHHQRGTISREAILRATLRGVPTS